MFTLRKFYWVFILFFVLACNHSKQTETTDTLNSGSITISVEESFKPVFTELLKVFLSQNHQCSVKIQFKSEIDCIRDLNNDSIRLVIVSRNLNDKEFQTIKKGLRFSPRSDIVAYSAIAVIIPKNQKDSFLSYAEILHYLDGQINIPVYVDQNNASATNRFLRDSILHQHSFGKNVKSALSNANILELVSHEHPSIGFIGYNWINDYVYNQEQKNYLNKLQFAAIECIDCYGDLKGTYSIPTPQSISAGYYPLRIPIYYILKENHAGLGSGFINFLSSESGQLIFKKSVLLPAKINFNKRYVKL